MIITVFCLTSGKKCKIDKWNGLNKLGWFGGEYFLIFLFYLILKSRGFCLYVVFFLDDLNLS